ncbi:uncharacterized protein BDW43DRAFT_315441 [Aspergillus alliaceus]|uniref:uncharacterized protein n=1 Tax=Petromyces alliaceus TaxID=209559 RepID=UPI0012A451DB|nr:uncharacterized protein BDW43DRAFT_315441 [Aspergillus alliaceus]KAB8228943.1 hypothetical protein BDW43DRAFT_315441 [Aspergillus alliaceus]
MESSLLSKHHHQQIYKWNSLAPTGPLDTSIQTVFHLQCMLQPDAQAICAWDGTLTYRELHKVSSDVQSLLRKYNLNPDSVVPILSQKSIWVVVSMLGVLKAGAAFVLLDPSYPTKRLQDICQDCGAKVIICSDETRATGLAERILVVGASNVLKATTRAVEPAKTTSHHAAYVVYTSGSTGIPKGIVIEHGSFCTNAITTSQAQNLDRSSRVLQFASYAFDVSVYECLAPLLLGGCVCIPSESQRMNSLKEAVANLRVNWAELTPSVARLWYPEDVPTIKTLVLGGEPMLPSDICRWKDNVRLVCAYGPAECTVVSTVQPHVHKPADIGMSPGGTCWIAAKDNHHKLAPIGSIGELIVGGPIVGRGYLNRPSLTASVFITNPRWAPLFQVNDTYRFYKTGDLVRYMSDGSITYVARKDTQVKLNGQRVELGEVEHQARQCFEHAVVVAEVAAPAGRKPSLVLFIAPTQSSSMDTDCTTLLSSPSGGFQCRVQAAKPRLQSVLPSHMIPTAYIELIAIPISRTGKVDRKMLREAVERITDQEFRAYHPAVHNNMTNSINPLTVEQLQRLFSATLGIPEEDIAPNDSFFQLGGDSVSAISFVGEAQDQGLEVTVELLLKHQTIRELAHVAHRTSNSGNSSIPALSLLGSLDKFLLINTVTEQCSVCPDQIEDIYPCTFLQEALVAYTAKRPAAFQAQFRFQLQGKIDLRRFKQAWATVIDANPILRTRIIYFNTEALQVVLRPKDHVQWDTTEDSFDHIELFMSYGTPLLRLAITGKPDGESPLYFRLSMHHAIFDGWSYALILDAIEAAYRHTHLPLQSFTPFIKHVLDLDYDSAKEFWCSEFKELSITTFPALPLSPRYAPKSITTIHRDIDVAEWLAGRHTPSIIAQLAFSMLIAWYTESLDVVYGLTVTGRNAPVPGIHRLTGPTIATFPLRTILHGSLRVREALLSVQDHMSRIIPFEQTGLQRIKSFSVEAATACNFQTLLIIQPARKSRPSEIFSEFPENAKEQLKFATCPLTLVCELGAHGLSAKALFDTTVITPNDIERILDQLEYLIGKINHFPECRIYSIIHSPSNEPIDPGQEQPWSSYVEKKAKDYIGEGFVTIVDTIAPKGVPNQTIALFICDNTMKNKSTELSDLFSRPTEKLRKRLEELMCILRQSLPWSVVPSLCLPINYIPSTPYGQPNRASLCEQASLMGLGALRSLMDPVHRSTDYQILPEEARLRGIVAHVLGIDAQSVNLKDDFFTLGGDSISAMQVVSLCRKHHLSLTALDIFDGKTIELIASSVKPLTVLTPPSTPRTERSLDMRFSLLPLTSDQDMEELESVIMATFGIETLDKIEDAYPCTQVHQGLLKTQLLEPFDYQSYTIWEVTTGSNVSPACPIRLRDAWLSLVRRHAALRTFLIDITLGDNTNCKVHVVQKDSVTDVSILSAAEEAVLPALRRSFLRIDSSICLPQAFTICQTISGRVFCKLEGSHAFLDAASVLIILRDLSLAYDGLLHRIPGQLYSSAVSWLQKQPDAEDQMRYWKRQLEDASPCIFPGLRRQVAHSETLVVNVPLADTATLMPFCTIHGLTISNVLQVAWGLTLRWYTASDNVCFGTLISGRDSPIPDIDNIVGSFFNVLVCQLHFGREDSLLDILRRNQVETGNRLLNQHCSLLEILRFSKYFGQPLFNTCISVEQPLSIDSSEASLCFKDVETHEPTEYDLIATITIGKADVRLALTYKSSLLTEEQASDVATRFRLSISDILTLCDA